MTEGLHTLQEFIAHTKGVLYIFAACYLIIFCGFWKFLTRNERDQEVDQGHEGGPRAAQNPEVDQRGEGCRDGAEPRHRQDGCRGWRERPGPIDHERRRYHQYARDDQRATGQW